MTRAMPTYTLLFKKHGGLTYAVERIAAETDEQAMQMAAGYAVPFGDGIEVHRDGHIVGRIARPAPTHRSEKPL